MEAGNQEKILAAISALESRVSALERSLGETSRGSNRSAEKKSVESRPSGTPVTGRLKDSGDWTGSSQLGWLGTIVSLIALAFIVRFAFLKEWILGWGQPTILVVMGVALFVIGDYIRLRRYPKFGLALTIIGQSVLFLAVFWATVLLKLLSPTYLLAGAGLIWVLSLAWGLRRGSVLWPLLGFVGAVILPLLSLGQPDFSWHIQLFFMVIIIGTAIVAVSKEWHLPVVIGSPIAHLGLMLLMRNRGATLADPALHMGEWLTVVIPMMLVIWSGIKSVVKERDLLGSEIFIYIFNNALFYFYTIVFIKQLHNPYVLIAPLLVNGSLFLPVFIRKPGSQPFQWFLSVTVIATATAMTVLLPEPFDIISLCMFSVGLALPVRVYSGKLFKGLSGALVIWSIIFLFTVRFEFGQTDHLDFFNFRFLSYIIAFLCFGYQGRLIDSDTSIGETAHILGQGLFSLGLLVLLGGLSGEVMHFFGFERDGGLTQNSLLALTIVGGFFSLIVAYTGVALRLYYIRLTALGLFILLIFKVLFFDLPGLGPLRLVISLVSVGLLLGTASYFFRRGSRASSPGQEP